MMNIDQFTKAYGHLKDVDKVPVDALCDHQEHKKSGKLIGRGPAKRNILKHGGKQFICRACDMKHNNPGQKSGTRQSDEIITVICPHPNHKGERSRTMAIKNYYGELLEPYSQVCKSCAMLGKVLTEEQKQKISDTLTGRKLSKEHVEKIRKHMKNNVEGIARAKANLIPGVGGGWLLGKSMDEPTKQKISKAMKGRKYTKKHRENISKGRKQMIKEKGGFTNEHRENISKSTVKQYIDGFDPKLHHLKGWHFSKKAGKVFHRSSYEKKAFMLLDDDESVDTYEVEAVTCKYLHPTKRINSTCILDLLVTFKDGRKMLVEVKPLKWLSDKIVQAKIASGQALADKLGIIFEVWDEKKLFGEHCTEKDLRAFANWLASHLTDISKVSTKAKAKKQRP